MSDESLESQFHIESKVPNGQGGLEAGVTESTIETDMSCAEQKSVDRRVVSGIGNHRARFNACSGLGDDKYFR